MLNFRKLKQEFAPTVLKEGQQLFEKQALKSANIVVFDEKSIKFRAKVQGSFNNTYESEVEIDRLESRVIDSNCDCAYTYDCQHLAAFFFHLEQRFDAMVLDFSTDNGSLKTSKKTKASIKKVFDNAICKESVRLDVQMQKEMIADYLFAADVLGSNPFFMAQEELVEEKADLGIIFNLESMASKGAVPFQIALRMPFRTKPLQVCHVKEFIEAIRYCEPILLFGKRRFFTKQSFDTVGSEIISLIIEHARFPGQELVRFGELEAEAFATLLAKSHELAMNRRAASFEEKRELDLPGLYNNSLESPLQSSLLQAGLVCDMELVELKRLLLQPKIAISDKYFNPDEAILLECGRPGVIINQTYYRFQENIKRLHLRYINHLREVAIPEPLFGSFVENALPQLNSYALVRGTKVIDKFVTIPFTASLKSRVELEYTGEQLEAKLFFLYGKTEIPAAGLELSYEHAMSFISKQGVLARDLLEEQRIAKELFEEFIYDSKQGLYIAKSEKKIVEFMTDIVPQNKERVHFDCPKNLLEKFVYDNTEISLHFQEHTAMTYEIIMTVKGHITGIKIAHLAECLAAKRSFIELKKDTILILNLDKIAHLLQMLDELGLTKIDNIVEHKPIWSLVNIQASLFDSIPVNWTMSQALKEVQEQIMGLQNVRNGSIPENVKKFLRPYQGEGVQWLERLRHMYLNGILADDMGLGKTLQAISALTQLRLEKPKSVSLIVCPTSLVYNWKQEVAKFNPEMRVLVIDGMPASRKKLLAQIAACDLVVTSYNLLQKDIDIYKDFAFSYVILDEGQQIKNRSTRNAKSVKQIQGAHRLILTGTPIENSLEDLWSLFDFLMPGLLGTFDRFQDKYLKQGQTSAIKMLKRKVAPFILRRMKSDVLTDLPPVSEIVYHCHLSELQKELYSSYAASAREELKKLVDKDGFDNVQIHVLATLTRLKQICCHPAIFAKEKAEEGDSAKYEMLIDLMQSLMEGGHKAVIFSQYSKMLSILSDDLQKRGIAFSYLDGRSKNRLEIVDNFNKDKDIPFFLVSLKAGGSGLNITGADTVIHYDMWWNPAVENQATDRVHRIGQTRSVSSYKLVTSGTIEEKIVELQDRKKGLVKKVISCDDEAMSKLTWEEVLQLLQT